MSDRENDTRVTKTSNVDDKGKQEEEQSPSPSSPVGGNQAPAWGGMNDDVGKNKAENGQLSRSDVMTALKALEDVRVDRDKLGGDDSEIEEEGDESCSEEYYLPHDTASVHLDLRGPEEYHAVCVDKFDGDYSESADPKDAREFETEAIADIDKLMRNDICTVTCNRPSEDEGAGAETIPVGFHGDMAVAVVIPSGVDTHGQRDPARRAEFEAHEYVRTVKEDLIAADTLREVEVIDAGVYSRAGSDVCVAAEMPSIKQALKKKIKVLEKKRRAAAERDKEEAARETGAWREAEERLEQISGLKPEPPLAKDPDVSSAIHERAIDKVISCEVDVVVTPVTSAKGGARRCFTLKLADGVIAQQKKVTDRLNAKEEKRELKEQMERRRALARTHLRYGDIPTILKQSEGDVSLENLYVSLQVAYLKQRELGKDARKKLKRARALYDKLLARVSKESPSKYVTSIVQMMANDDPEEVAKRYQPLHELIDFDLEADVLSNKLMKPQDIKLSAFVARAEHLAKAGTMDDLEEMTKERLKVADTLIEFHSPQKTRALSVVYKEVKKARKLAQKRQRTEPEGKRALGTLRPIVWELQRAVVAAEELIASKKLRKREHKIDPELLEATKKGRRLLQRISADDDTLRPLAQIVQEYDQPGKFPSMWELDVAIAVESMRQWDGQPSENGISCLMRGRFYLASLVTELYMRCDAENARRLGEERSKERNYDFTAWIKYLDFSEYRTVPLKWRTATKHHAIKTTGALAMSGDSKELIVGRTRGVSVHLLPLGTKTLDLTMAPEWGGRVRHVSGDSRFILAIFDYPLGVKRTTTFCGLVFNRETREARLIDTGAVALTCMIPEPTSDSFWIGTELGYMLCVSWENETFDASMHSLLIASSIAPIRKMCRIGRRLHVLTSADGFSFDVQPLKGESLDEMVKRVGRPVRHKFLFPSDIKRWGTIYLVVERDYATRLICGEVVRVVAAMEHHKKAVETGAIHPYAFEQYLSFDRERIAVFYGDGVLRLLWPGSTATQYEEEAVKREREELQRLLKEDLTKLGDNAESSSDGKAAPPPPPFSEATTAPEGSE